MVIRPQVSVLAILIAMPCIAQLSVAQTSRDAENPDRIAPAPTLIERIATNPQSEIFKLVHAGPSDEASAVLIQYIESMDDLSNVTDSNGFSGSIDSKCLALEGLGFTGGPGAERFLVGMMKTSSARERANVWLDAEARMEVESGRVVNRGPELEIRLRSLAAQALATMDRIDLDATLLVQLELIRKREDHILTKLARNPEYPVEVRVAREEDLLLTTGIREGLERALVTIQRIDREGLLQLKAEFLTPRSWCGTCDLDRDQRVARLRKQLESEAKP